MRTRKQTKEWVRTLCKPRTTTQPTGTKPTQHQNLTSPRHTQTKQKKHWRKTINKQQPPGTQKGNRTIRPVRFSLAALSLRALLPLAFRADLCIFEDTYSVINVGHPLKLLQGQVRLSFRNFDWIHWKAHQQVLPDSLLSLQTANSVHEEDRRCQSIKSVQKSAPQLEWCSIVQPSRNHSLFNVLFARNPPSPKIKLKWSLVTANVAHQWLMVVLIHAIWVMEEPWGHMVCVRTKDLFNLLRRLVSKCDVNTVRFMLVSMLNIQAV